MFEISNEEREGVEAIKRALASTSGLVEIRHGFCIVSELSKPDFRKLRIRLLAIAIFEIERAQPRTAETDRKARLMA